MTIPFMYHGENFPVNRLELTYTYIDSIGNILNTQITVPLNYHLLRRVSPRISGGRKPR